MDKTKIYGMWLHKSYINSKRFDELYVKDGKNIIERTSGRIWEFVTEEDECIKYEIYVIPVYH